MKLATKRRLIGAGAVLGISLLFSAGWGGESNHDDAAAYENISLLTRAIELIRQDSVYENRTSYKSLVHAALKGMLQSLDPHSQFMESGDLKGMKEDTDSEFDGLGLTVTIKDGALVILAPMEDSPAFKAGIAPHDQVLKINGKSTERLSLGACCELLKGPLGEKVTLTIFHPETKRIKDVVLERSVIKVDSVKEATILPDNGTPDSFRIGYLRITQFNRPTGHDLEARLNDLEKQGMQGLIIDLRFNPGGLLESAVEVCSLFLPPDQLVVTTEGRVPSQSKTYKTPKTRRNRRNYPIAILVNSSTASAAEIVSGALKDLHRAILVGETTFGKGSVQSVVELQDGSAIRLTTAKYYTPSHQVIHEKGIAPNILAVADPDEERMILAKRREELLSDEDRSKLKWFEDLQKERALVALKGVLLFSKNGHSKRVNAPEKNL